MNMGMRRAAVQAIEKSNKYSIAENFRSKKKVAPVELNPGIG